MGRVIQLWTQVPKCDGYCKSGRLPCTCRLPRAADVIAERAAVRQACARPAKATGAHRVYLLARAFALRLQIARNERYIDRCRPDGLDASLDLAAFRSHIEAQRVRLATLERRL